LSFYRLHRFVSRLRLQRYNLFLNLQAFDRKKTMKSLFFFFRASFSTLVAPHRTALTWTISSFYSFETECNAVYSPHCTYKQDNSEDNFLCTHSPSNQFSNYIHSESHHPCQCRGV